MSSSIYLILKMLKIKIFILSILSVLSNTEVVQLVPHMSIIKNKIAALLLHLSEI